MRVESLVPDVAVPRGPGVTTDTGGEPNGTSGPRGAFGSSSALGVGVGVGGVANGNAFGALVDAAGALLDRADVAEARFAAHQGGLQEMVVERARADIALQAAATAAQRTAQALQTLLGMQL